MSSNRPVYLDAVLFVRIVNACRQVAQSTLMLYFSFALSTYVVKSPSLIIIIIKLYLYTDKSGTAAPFTGVYTHYDKKKYIDHKSSKRKNIL